MKFYENYLRLCNQAGKRPTALAEELGMARASASRWARGSMPSFANLVKIADYFGVSVGELVGATPENVSAMAKLLNVSEALLGTITTAKEDTTGKYETSNNLEEALELLRSTPGRRALLAATKNMTEEQVQRMADWLNEFTNGGNQ